VCGGAFYVYPSQATRLYCSQSCYLATLRRVIERPCEQCGVLFLPRFHEARFCTRLCYDASHTRLTKTCELCGVVFLAGGRGGARRSARFCSRACSSSNNGALLWAGKPPQYPKTCVTCGKAYIARRGSSLNCSKACKKLRTASKRAGYQAKYRASHPHIPVVLSPRPCLYCGVDFTPLRHRTATFCTTRCYHNWRYANDPAFSLSVRQAVRLAEIASMGV
jgi:hypothetical protein